jgi:NAD(P)-dependent dehydrogenase (short-subunit alcohol dehydrogenase family)
VGDDLAGRVAIVGLEQAELARRLAVEGATVVVVSDDAEAAGALLAEIEAEAGPGRAAYFRMPASPPAPAAGAAGAAEAAGEPSSGPMGSALDALVEFVAGMWPATRS